jgi:hypothetical protein
VSAYVAGRQTFDVFVGAVQTIFLWGWLYIVVFPEVPAAR